MIIKLNINLASIDKSKIFTSPKTGKKYLNLTLFDNRDGQDQYGQDGVAKHEISKEERDAGETKSTIVGNWKWIARPEGTAAAQKPAKATFKKPEGAPTEEQDEVPF